MNNNNQEKADRGSLWQRIAEDIKMDNASKARLAEEAVQDLQQGLQRLFDADECFGKHPPHGAGK